ncbi:hypothetical protein C8R45DRAFT_920247 [Mycena sanguinolenta]|nr:hypothetical protein C8R45DRAFT_920247 [Mycena sanguinolenta]
MAARVRQRSGGVGGSGGGGSTAAASAHLAPPTAAFGFGFMPAGQQWRRWPVGARFAIKLRQQGGCTAAARVRQCSGGGGRCNSAAAAGAGAAAGTIAQQQPGHLAYSRFRGGGRDSTAAAVAGAAAQQWRGCAIVEQWRGRAIAEWQFRGGVMVQQQQCSGMNAKPWQQCVRMCSSDTVDEAAVGAACNRASSDGGRMQRLRYPSKNKLKGFGTAVAEVKAAEWRPVSDGTRPPASLGLGQKNRIYSFGFPSLDWSRKDHVFFKIICISLTACRVAYAIDTEWKNGAHEMRACIGNQVIVHATTASFTDVAAAQAPAAATGTDIGYCDHGIFAHRCSGSPRQLTDAAAVPDDSHCDGNGQQRLNGTRALAARLLTQRKIPQCSSSPPADALPPMLLPPNYWRHAKAKRALAARHSTQRKANGALVARLSTQWTLVELSSPPADAAVTDTMPEE